MRSKKRNAELVFDAKLTDAAARWQALPAKRRRAVVGYYTAEILEQKGFAAHARVSGGRDIDAERWCEENEIVLAILDAIKPTRVPRMKRRRG